jgi:hypothetical protein
MGTALQRTIQQLRSEDREYFQIANSVDCVIFGFDQNELKVLLIKSDLEEFNNQWSLLGDLVRPEEDLDNASYRVLCILLVKRAATLPAGLLLPLITRLLILRTTSLNYPTTNCTGMM